MKLCLAKEMEKWLEDVPKFLASHMDSKVCIVGIIGKAPLSDNWAKTGPFNDFLEKEVFRNAWCLEGAKPQIEAYFDPGTETVFLHLLSYHDSICANQMFAPTDTEMEFYENLAKFEADYMRNLLFLFLVTHIVVLVEPCCRLDTTYIRLLRTLNSLREDSVATVSDLLLGVENMSKTWAATGRMSSPRLLFAFHRSPIRADLGYTKRRELIKKLEHSMEDQIYSLFRKSRVITNDSSHAICAVPFNQQFVYIFGPGESVKDPMQNLLESLHSLAPMNLVSAAETEAAQELLNQSNDSDGGSRSAGVTKSDVSGFFEFLNTHVEQAHGNGFNDNVGKMTPPASFKIPKMSLWVDVAKVLWKFVVLEGAGQKDFRNLGPKVNVELEFSDSRCRKVLPLAISTYQDGLPAFYPRHQHETKLNQALTVLASQARGPWLADSIRKLTEDCESYWKSGREACETLSLTGNNCVHRVHIAPSNKTDADSSDEHAEIPVLNHTSKARYLSTCNCGMRQELRDDPFTLKEANFGFYELPEFSCCRKLEKYDFPLFVPPDTKESTLNESDKTVDATVSDTAIAIESAFQQMPISTQSQEVASVGGPSTDGEPFLPDRDNRPVIEGTEVTGKSEEPSDEIEEKEMARFTGEVDAKGEIAVKTQEDEELGEGSTSESAGSAIENLLDDEKYFDRMDDLDTPRTLRRRGGTVDRDDSDAESSPGMLSGNEDPIQPSDLDMSEISKISSAYQLLNLDEKEEKTPVAIMTEQNLEEKYRGQYLEGMPHNHSNPNLLPLFPSWSMLCLGASSLYTHAHGLRDMPNFSHGSIFLLPWDVNLKVDLEKWRSHLDAMQAGASSRRPERSQKPKKSTGEGTVNVKVFLGFEYECPRGHRFMMQSSDKILKYSGPGGPKDISAGILTRSDLPLWFPCSCRSSPPLCGQLTRLHVVTPKAPVIVTLSPKIQPNTSIPVYFHPGTRGLIQMTGAKYYVLRFPYAFVGPNGPFYPPKDQIAAGRVIKGCLGVVPDYQ